LAVGNTITTGLEQLRSQVAGAIQRAASATGAGFDYLVATARIESNFNPNAAAPTSSARGLYQFIEQTWLGTVKEAGSQLGYGKYADAITKTSSGRYEVSDPAAKAEILALRNDPSANASMAGVLTNSNRLKLTGRLGRAPSDSELYMAHFLGASGAGRLAEAMRDKPGQRADAIFPAAAAANRSIFYDRNGGARSVADVYAVIENKYAGAMNSPSSRAVAAAGGVQLAAGAQLADASTRPPAVAATERNVPEVAMFLAAFPQAQISDSGSPTPAAFKGGERAQPVAPAIQSLWANAPPANARSAAGGFDLFSDRSGTFSG
jgi:hypothetical protein